MRLAQHTLLNIEPRPLVDAPRKMALLWSAKSGCTFAVKWFFSQVGLLNAALSYDQWVHEYREKVYYQSKTYREGLNTLLTEDYIVIKVVRCPFERIVSSYIHALRYGYEDASIGRFMGREVSNNSGFSFEEFVNYLITIDISQCDIHHKQQVHPLESEGLLIPKHIVKLEDSLNTLREIETEYNLKATPLETLMQSYHNIQRTSGAGFCGTTHYTKRHQAFNNYTFFYDSDLMDKVVSIYEKDFDAYEYPKILDLPPCQKRELSAGTVRGRIRQFLDSNAHLLSPPVLEIGSLLPSKSAWWANNRNICDGSWIGLDIERGCNVDVVASGYSLPCEGASFNGVVCSEVLEHVFRPADLLKEINRVLKPGKWTIITTLFSFPIHNYPEDYWRYSPACLEKLLKDVGFRDVTISTAGEVSYLLNDHGEERLTELTAPMHVFAIARK